MFGLKLRDEFKGRGLSDTAVELSSAAEGFVHGKKAGEFLGKTYPTQDILKALRAISRWA
jgi:hypothetical protein